MTQRSTNSFQSEQQSTDYSCDCPLPTKVGVRGRYTFCFGRRLIDYKSATQRSNEISIVGRGGRLGVDILVLFIFLLARCHPSSPHVLCVASAGARGGESFGRGTDAVRAALRAKTRRHSSGVRRLGGRSRVRVNRTLESRGIV